VIDEMWPAWNGTRLICGGCGRSAPPIDREAAIEMIEDLTDRLLRLWTDGRVAPAWALDTVLAVATAQVRRTLSSLDTHLRGLSPLSGLVRTRSPGPAAVTPSLGGPNPAGRSGMLDGAARLAWTITAMADSDWRDRSTGDGVCPAELVWTALHNAVHAVEDVELCLPPAEEAAPVTMATAEPPAGPLGA
jgi:hypothetical protein